jgi:tetratricopeptide (TPR) repeat protein
MVPLFVMFAITALCIYLWKKGRRIWLIVWAVFVLHLLPVPGIFRIGGYFAAERYTYIPSIGPFLLIGLGVSLMWEKSRGRKRYSFLNRKLFIPIITVIVFLLCTLTVKQINTWHDNMTLWTRELKIYPDVEFAHHNRAIAYIKRNDYSNAIKDLDKAIILNPVFAKQYKAYTNRCGAYEKLGNLERAMRDCSRALEIDPQDIMAYFNRGIVLLKMGKNNRAAEDFQKAAMLGDEKAKEILEKIENAL